METGEIDETELLKLARYDYTRLVLSGLGAKTSDIDFDQSVVHQGMGDIGEIENWTLIDTEIQTNGPSHTPDGFKIGYLQYGYPPAAEVDFPETKMFSRIWIKYFEAQEVTIIYYAITPSSTFLDEMSDAVIYESHITFN